MNYHKSFVTLQMVQWIDGAIIRIQLGYFEPTRDLLLYDLSRERGIDVELSWISIFSLEASKSVVDLLKPTIVVIKPLVSKLLRNFINRSLSGGLK